MSTPKRSLLPISILILLTLLTILGLWFAQEKRAAVAENQPAAATIQIDTTENTGYADPMLLGTNLPTWLHRFRLPDSNFRDLAYYSGVSLMPLPGGSWSNTMDWLACERGGQGIDGSAQCQSEDPNASWVAKPSDSINFLQDTCQEAMYTVNQNGTSKELAALVAFFNSSVNDAASSGLTFTAGIGSKLVTGHNYSATTAILIL